MARAAYLKKVNDRDRTQRKLRKYTDDDPAKIIAMVGDGVPQLITDLGCEACKADLEMHDAAVVEIR